MPKGKQLTDVEKGQILVLHNGCLSVREIAESINRSKTVVHNFMKNPQAYGSKKRSGMPPKLTPGLKRRVIREASKREKSANQIRKALDLPVHRSHVQALSRKDTNLNIKYTKFISALVLTPMHMQQRLDWAKNHVTWDDEKWNKIIFSDEKKFNLDGPDGCHYYWHELRKEKKVLSRRHQGCDSLMIWSCFSYYGRKNLVIMYGKQDSAKYCEILKDDLLPFAGETHGENWTYQQDNASINRSFYTKKWFTDNGVAVLPWPSRSPDLNPIENLWRILARSVYGNERQYQDSVELFEASVDCWQNFDHSILENLVGLMQMQRRCIAVLQKNGDRTSY
ncbi:unnamed protein product [Chondrus crispus]|uniref:Tc3 transposase DNA binding domain-containing protein n=1 Tax=Chondrus crispus TaxID=2769 RepID=R7QK64_CHOCR|nr:unnamed protein product [Chondrus crispus]CDF37795.1 unnamed protein product [Chondrus crispus]|eukprot:XP_005717666.1 unnamed protein product [Chondrus crispus]